MSTPTTRLEPYPDVAVADSILPPQPAGPRVRRPLRLHESDPVGPVERVEERFSQGGRLTRSPRLGSVRVTEARLLLRRRLGRHILGLAFLAFLSFPLGAFLRGRNVLHSCRRQLVVEAVRAGRY